MVNGKKKGGSFERLICERLSRWIDPDSDEAHFWRSAMSGGRSTVRSKKGKLTKSQVGDISALTPAGMLFTNHFMVECKHLKNLKLTSALLTGTGLFAEIWGKLRDDADHNGKKPLLIARQNGMPIIAVIRMDDQDYFRMGVEDQLGQLFCVDSHALVIFRFGDLLARRYRMEHFE